MPKLSKLSNKKNKMSKLRKKTKQVKENKKRRNTKKRNTKRKVGGANNINSLANLLEEYYDFNLQYEKAMAKGSSTRPRSGAIKYQMDFKERKIKKDFNINLSDVTEAELSEKAKELKSEAEGLFKIRKEEGTEPYDPKKYLSEKHLMDLNREEEAEAVNEKIFGYKIPNRKFFGSL